MLCDHLEGWDREGGREAQEGGDICICIADSLCYTAETNTTMENNYTPIKMLKKTSKRKKFKNKNKTKQKIISSSIRRNFSKWVSNFIMHLSHLGILFNC